MHTCQLILFGSRCTPVSAGVHVCPLSGQTDSCIFSELSQTGVTCVKVCRPNFCATTLAFIYTVSQKNAKVVTLETMDL